MTAAPARLAIAIAATVAAVLTPLATAADESSLGATVGVTAGLPGEFHFKLSKTRVPHGKVTILVTNRGNLPHNFRIAGKTTPLLQQGKSTRIVVTFRKAGKYPYLCTVTGHAAAGMKGVLRVT